MLNSTIFGFDWYEEMCEEMEEPATTATNEETILHIDEIVHSKKLYPFLNQHENLTTLEVLTS